MRASPIIPLRQDLIKLNILVLFHVSLEITGYFFTGGKGLVHDMGEDLQPGLSRSTFIDKFGNRINRIQQDTLQSAGNVREEAVINGIVLGTIGRIVSDADGQAGTYG